MRPKTGPLTDRQMDIVTGMMNGRRHKETARAHNLSESSIRNEATVITAKFGAETSVQAIGRYATAVAYCEAADELRKVKLSPQMPNAGSVNLVLEELARLLERRAANIMPQ